MHRLPGFALARFKEGFPTRLKPQDKTFFFTRSFSRCYRALAISIAVAEAGGVKTHTSKTQRVRLTSRPPVRYKMRPRAAAPEVVSELAPQRAGPESLQAEAGAWPVYPGVLCL